VPRKRVAEPIVRVPFGERVRELRDEKGMSLAELADRASRANADASMSKSHLCGIEYGSANPQVMTLNHVAKGLGVAPRDLLNVPRPLSNPKASELEQCIELMRLLPIGKVWEAILVVAPNAKRFHRRLGTQRKLARR